MNHTIVALGVLGLLGWFTGRGEGLGRRPAVFRFAPQPDGYPLVVINHRSPNTRMAALSEQMGINASPHMLARANVTYDRPGAQPTMILDLGEDFGISQYEAYVIGHELAHVFSRVLHIPDTTHDTHYQGEDDGSRVPSGLST